jgi:hypothetical protein
MVSHGNNYRPFMKKIRNNELFQNLSSFLKTRGIEIREGTYATRIQTGCSLLTEAINAGQKGVQQAKAGIDKKLERMRQVIHEKTAPAPAKPAPAAARKTKPRPASKPARKGRKA